MVDFYAKYIIPTVDGSEIRRSPVEGQVVYPMIYKGFSTIPGGCLGFLPTTNISLKKPREFKMHILQMDTNGD